MLALAGQFWNNICTQENHIRLTTCIYEDKGKQLLAFDKLRGIFLSNNPSYYFITLVQ